MRIGLVCPYNFDYPGGVQQHVFSLYQEFKEQGHYVKIITPKTKTKNIPFLKEAIFLGRSVRFPTNVTSLQVSLDVPRASELRRGVLAKERFEIIHFHEPVNPFLCWQLLRASQAVNIGTFHSAFQSELAVDFYRTAIQPLDYFFLRRLDGLIAVSSAAWDSWKEFVEKRDGVIIPHGIDLSRFKPKKKKRGKRVKILFVGRLEPRKGIMDLLRAFKILVKKVPQVSLTIVGSGPSSYRAKLFVEQHLLRGRVKFIHQVPDKKLPPHYAEADICCFPAAGEESFGIVLLEAMAMGKPLVVYANAGYLTILKNYPWKKGLVPVKRWKKLAEALSLLAADEKLQDTLGKWGSVESRKYDYRITAKKVLAYYRQILKKKKG